MLKKKNPASKRADTPTKKTDIHISYVLDSSQTEKEFIYRARQLYRQRYPKALNKGGRPSIEPQVWDAADQVWNQWSKSSLASIRRLCIS